MTGGGYFTTPALYDRMYATFTADIGVHLDDARAAGGPVLEVCCGNGRLLLPLREAGIDVDGLDFDAPLLADLRDKLARRGLTAALHHADMRDFDLERRYALVFLGFNSFLHNTTQADQLRTLAACRRHLAPGGQLTLTAFHPSAAKLARFDGTPFVAIEYDTLDGGKTIVRDAIVTDRVEQVNRVRRTVEVLDAAGVRADWTEHAFDLRYVYKPEMELLLRVAGFARWDARSPFAGYAGERYAAPRPPEDGGVIVWRAWP